jgi:hypothetical protein
MSRLWSGSRTPDPGTESVNQDEASGTFLYLTEARLDGGQTQTTFSGCSALQAIVNAANGRPLLQGNDDGEPLGRQTYEHPIKKLIDVGARVSGEARRIESLYYIRYITDEQCHTRDSKLLRGNDLLGYPLFIAERV